MAQTVVLAYDPYGNLTSSTGTVANLDCRFVNRVEGSGGYRAGKL